MCGFCMEKFDVCPSREFDVKGRTSEGHILKKQKRPIVSPFVLNIPACLFLFYFCFYYCPGSPLICVVVAAIFSQLVQHEVG